MALVYTADREIIEAILEKLKQDGGVSPEATFHYDSFQKLRQEVHGGDFGVQLPGEKDGRSARAAANIRNLQMARPVESGQFQSPFCFGLSSGTLPCRVFV